MEFLQHFLPDTPQIRLEHWHLDRANTHLYVTVSSTQTLAVCPVCQALSRRVHSRYERTLEDLSLAQYRMTLQLQVCKFFCVNPLCQRRIFTERLPQVTVPWGRRTCRLAQSLGAIALALGGTAGVRLCQQLGHTISRNTLLQLVYRLPMPPTATAQTLGVDDFAWRKGQRYGTIVVDLEQHRPIALLQDREAATLAQWLQQHPGVQVLSRDRSKAYKQGMSEGAPDAVQVADRFHLLQNLSAVLVEVFQQQIQALKAVDLSPATMASPPATASPAPPVGVIPPPEIEPADAQYAQQVRARRLSTYQQVWQLHQQGSTQKAIAQQLGIGVKTIYRYLRSPTFPEWQQRKDRGQSYLDAYQAQILKRWNQGCHDAKQLYQELLSWGCQTSYSTVARYCRRLRQAQGLLKRQRHPTTELAPLPQVQRRPLTPLKAAWLVLARVEQRQRENEQLLLALQAQSPALSTAIHLGQVFVEMVHNRQWQQLDSWLSWANNSGLEAFIRFAKGIQEDYDAVKAGLALPWSNGQVEGQINRLKMIKRQMYGRASLELLERRVLLAN